MKSRVESLAKTIHADLEANGTELGTAKEVVRRLTQERRQLVSALKSCGEDGPGNRGGKPAPNQEQVQGVLNDLLLEAGGQLPAGGLEALVAERLAAEHACSAVGLALRMREVLAGEAFVVRGNQVGLAGRTEKRPSIASFAKAEAAGPLMDRATRGDAP